MGKWHLGTINQTALPLQRGFDRFWGMPYSTDMGCPPAVDFPCLPTAGPSTEWTPGLISFFFIFIYIYILFLFKFYFLLIFYLFFIFLFIF